MDCGLTEEFVQGMPGLSEFLTAVAGMNCRIIYVDLQRYAYSMEILRGDLAHDVLISVIPITLFCRCRLITKTIH